MKKFIYLLALACTLGTFTACSDDDDPKDETKRLEAIEGTWNVQPTTYDEQYNANGSVVINWEGDDDAIINLPMGDENDPTATSPYPMSYVPSLLKLFTNSQLETVLKDVTFTQDGKIAANYKDADDSDWEKAEDYASYQVVSDNLITVFLNTSKITEGIDDAEEKAMITGILNKFSTGIPVHVALNGNKATFYVDKEFIEPVITMLIAQIDQIPTTDMDQEELAQFQLIKGIAAQIPTIMSKTKKFEIGLELIK